jgi:Enoyl-CoA hydratase/carnithine racemase
MNDYRSRDWTGLRLEVDGHTAVVTLANPPAHTWTVHSLAALRDLVRALDADRDIYALVITGDGEKFFSAGADLKQFASGDKAAAREAARRFGEAFEALSAFRGVSIAAINGYAMGGGLECALACDLRIIEDTPRSPCPRPPSACCPAPAAPRTCRDWSARAGPSA